VDAVVDVAQLLCTHLAACGGILARPEEPRQGMLLREAPPADVVRDFGRRGDGTRRNAPGHEAADAVGSRAAEVPAHPVEDLPQRLEAHVPEGEGDEVVRADLAAAVDV